jgi:F0F1-type ATP synthase membrane subunit b/b'
LSPTVSTLLFEAANFLLLAAVLGWLFFRPVRAALEQRRSELEAAQRDAAAKRAEAERVLADARARQARLESSLDALREQLGKQAEAEKSRLIAEAREQAQRERDALKTELAAQRRSQARARMRDVASAASAIVARLLGEIEGPELEGALLEAAQRQLAALKASGALAPVIVESTRPLGADALAALARSGGLAPAELSARVVPELVAGVRVLTARGLVDASAAGLAAEAERALVARLEAEGDAHG